MATDDGATVRGLLAAVGIEPARRRGGSDDPDVPHAARVGRRACTRPRRRASCPRTCSTDANWRHSERRRCRRRSPTPPPRCAAAPSRASSSRRRCSRAPTRTTRRSGTYVARFDETALAAAAQADADFAAGVDRGPLQGIPLGVKDIIAAREGATTACSKVLDPDWGRGVDAPAVARLRAQGGGHHREDDHDGVRDGRAR